MVDQDYVKKAFSYDCSTGIAKWNYRDDRTPQWNGRYANTEIGCVAYFAGGGPYRMCNIEGTTYLVHRLIWLWIHGYMPVQVDHKDCNGLNNKEHNLREATQSLNNANKKVRAKGYHKHGRGYKARIKVNGQQIYLGIWDTEEEAQAIYNAAAVKYFGEFASCNRFARRI